MDEQYRIPTRSKWITFFGCLCVFSIIFFISGIFANQTGFAIGFSILGGVMCLASVIGCVWACRTSRYDIDDLPIRIREDMGLV